ncbi:protein serine/threonine kinase [Aureococcus anophagefferens]|uniref:Protein serine/threonine kinase n=1 Tax=Aureococcus anophagefferens TaxID=44056 RepID=A0ABR1GA23_AURAN
MEDYLRVVRAHDSAATWQLSCAVDDAVVRLRPLSEGWVEVRRVDNSAVGAVPEACVARCELRAAAYAFDAGEPWQLGLRVGAVVAELRDVGQGWSEVVDETGLRGCVPGAYLGPPLDPDVSRLKEVNRSALAALALADDDATGGGGGWEVEDDFGGWRRYDAAAAAALDAAWARDGARGVVKFRSGNPDPCDYAVDLARMAQRSPRAGKLRTRRRGSGAPASPASPAPSAGVAPAALAVDAPPLRRIDDVALVDRVERRARRRRQRRRVARRAARAAASAAAAAAPPRRGRGRAARRRGRRRAARRRRAAARRRGRRAPVVHERRRLSPTKRARPPGWKPPPPPRREKPAAMPPIDEAKSVAGPAGEYEALLRKVLADGLVHFQELGVGLGWTDDDFSRSGASPRAATPKRPASRTLPPLQPKLRGAGGVVEYAVDELAAATDQWAAARRLGGGGFGDVFRGALRGGDVAIKRVHAQSPRGCGSSRRRSALGKLRDPSLVRLLGHGRRGAGDFCLVYELCDGGTLEDRLADKRNPLDWSAASPRARDAIRGLYYLHTQGDGEKCFIHGDVKTANILLTSAGGAKLSRTLRAPRRGLAASEVCKDARSRPGGIFKGALTASMLLAGDGFEERFVFTTAHLPAHEGRAEKRNAALARIRQRVAKKRGFFYLNSRLPSYTDRILYAASDAGGDRAGGPAQEYEKELFDGAVPKEHAYRSFLTWMLNA